MKYEKKTYTLIGVIVLNLIFISCREKEMSNQNRKDIQSDSTTLVTNKSVHSLETDSSILRTDNEGNILGGDLKDWNFDKNYNEIQKYLFNFNRVISKNEPRPAVYGLEEPFTAEVYDNVIILKWFTSSEVDNKGFYVERTEYIKGIDDTKWLELGFVKGSGNSEKERKYKFIDKHVKIGTSYNYRLKQVSFKDEINYHSLPRDVFVMKYPNQMEFYPAYPNPVNEKVTVSFYVPKKDIVSLYFLNGKDTTYILDQEPQERGFYKLTVDKKSLGFENEIKRLYINCKSCDKKKNFGDIQF